MEEKFQAICDEAIQKAEAVRCNGGEFIQGLELIVEQFHDRLAAAREEFDG